MTWSYLSTIVFTVTLLTVSCNKEKEPAINPCLNGQLDPGETAIDCGGNCGNCPDAEYPYAGFTANGVSLIASSKQLSNSNGWRLNMANDSVSMQLNLGADGVVGTYTMNAAGSYASYNGLSYPTLTEGIFSISGHNTVTHKMSGFFQGKFVRVPGDTLYITNGFFEYLPY